MTTIVLNTLNSAVTEYDWAFQSITPTHAGDATALYMLGGDLDALAKIEAEVVTGTTQLGDSRKKFVDMVYFAMRGAGFATLVVRGRDKEYRYDFPVRDTGESRAKPGMGIRENYLAFGFANLDGAGFDIDRIEAIVAQSSTRRV